MWYRFCGCSLPLCYHYVQIPHHRKGKNNMRHRRATARTDCLQKFFHPVRNYKITAEIDTRMNTGTGNKWKGNFLLHIFVLLLQQFSLDKKHWGCTFQKRFPHDDCCLRMSLQFLPILKLNFPFSLLGKYQYSNGSLPTRSWSAPQKERVHSWSRGGEEDS